MSTFGAVTFSVSQDGWSEAATSAVGVRGFPGANNWALTLAGQREITRTAKCVFANRTAYLSMRALRGTSASLTVTDWDTSAVTAVLTDLTAERLAADGQVVAQAQFILT